MTIHSEQQKQGGDTVLVTKRHHHSLNPGLISFHKEEVMVSYNQNE